MSRVCVICGRIIPNGSRCARHPLRWRNGSTRQWRKRRLQILERDGYQCTHVDGFGRRCTATQLLEIHHASGGSQLADVPDWELATLCRKHHPRGG